VHESLLPRFVEAFTAATDAVVLGNGLEAGVTMGPLANERRVKAMEELVTDAVARGARLLRGGARLDRQGYWFPPTVLTDVPGDARMMMEEPFGPVAPIVPFTELDEALRVANALPYGLAAYGFTRSTATAEKLVREFEAGILSINHCGGSVHEAPSGGVKSSGYGREGGPEGLEAYLTTKRVSHLLVE
jgi:succinate-semialdehyde dehydrogenase/glutarate-semialdehyde dehydrogenase